MQGDESSRQLAFVGEGGIRLCGDCRISASTIDAIDTTEKTSRDDNSPPAEGVTRAVTFGIRSHHARRAKSKLCPFAPTASDLHDLASWRIRDSAPSERFCPV